MSKVDFSPMHDVMIRNFDGSYQPMDEPFFEAEKIAENTWKILSDGDYSYLVAGTECACVVDSGYGAGDLKAFCQSLVEVPVKGVINTHHHFDHTANNCYFGVAYMDAKAVDQATIPYPSFEKLFFPRDYQVVTVEDGYVFDLGDRSLEVFQIPDHTEDGIALLDRKEKLLFSGDEFMKSKTLVFSVSHWKRCLEKLMAHRTEFERLCAGEGVLEATIVDLQYRIVNEILAGKEGEEMQAPGGPGGLRGNGKNRMGDSGRPEKRPDGFGRGGEANFNPMNPETYEGHKVYYRKFPHPEDVHRAPKEHRGVMKCVELDGYRMMYDSSKILDE
jgi:glyoxylase-like metal-dependent hydrolase (beta-lactamase superfamily II)